MPGVMIGVSVATLRSWEQGRRVPDGPPLALLRVAAKAAGDSFVRLKRFPTGFCL
jgi:DNA-binding transcriptional regulator YiaG